jgi:Secretion system C-terminal sorting domain
LCNLYQCQDITVVESSGNCTVDLTVSVSGTTVNATAVGTGATLENYIISWGDNTISNSASASHVYSIAGDYEICVYYGDLTPNGCQVSDCQTITAEAGTGDCTLDITVNPVGLNVVVTANGFGAEAPEYSIDWGDGTAMDNGVPATHLYSAAGTYQVCVSYIDLNNIAGCQVNQCQTVTISEGTSDCVVDLVVTTDGLNVSATATGTGATNPTYAINWGDGTFPSLGATGTYTYADEGTFDVCVTYLDLNNVAGCAVTDCQTIIVTGISESILSQNSIQVMPNPLADNSTLMISLNRNADVEINAYDLIGNKVDNIMNGSRGQGTHRISWNTENLASGIYFVKVKANNEEKTIKVIR